MSCSRKSLIVLIVLLPAVFVSDLWKTFLADFFFPLLSSIPFAIPLSLFVFFRKRIFSLLLCAAFLIAVLWTPFYTERCLYDSVPEEAELVELLAFLAESADACEDTKASPLEICALSLKAIQTLFPDRWIGKPARFAYTGGFMRKIGIAGIFVPLTGEAVISPSEPGFTLPFAACHELAHRIGYADEGYANLIAYRACISSESEAFRYSGYLHALKYTLIWLNRICPESECEFRHMLPEKIERDLQRIGTWNEDAGNTRAFPSFAGDYSDMIPALLKAEQ